MISRRLFIISAVSLPTLGSLKFLHSNLKEIQNQPSALDVESSPGATGNDSSRRLVIRSWSESQLSATDTIISFPANWKISW